VGHPTAPQFVTVDHLGEALKQVQEAVIKGICELMKVSDPRPRAEEGSVLGGSATPISGARPLLRRAPVDIAPSRSVATPYASKEQEAAWYMEQEESSRPPRSGRE